MCIVAKLFVYIHFVSFRRLILCFNVLRLLFSTFKHCPSLLQLVLFLFVRLFVFSTYVGRYMSWHKHSIYRKYKQNTCKINRKRIVFAFLHLHEIVEGLYFHCSLSVCVCVCPAELLLTKIKPNEWTDLDAVFAKWLLPALARTLLNLVTLGQRSRSQWCNTHFFFIIIC